MLIQLQIYGASRFFLILAVNITTNSSLNIPLPKMNSSSSRSSSPNSCFLPRQHLVGLFEQITECFHFLSRTFTKYWSFRFQCIPNLKAKFWHRCPSTFTFKSTHKFCSAKLLVNLQQSQEFSLRLSPSSWFFPSEHVPLPQNDSYLRQNLLFSLPRSQQSLCLLITGLTRKAHELQPDFDDHLCSHKTMIELRVFIFLPAYFIALPAESPFSEICIR